jgi:EAL domain-containing protein (putative c-di-GMP-specific phosphodiesterase class I)
MDAAAARRVRLEARLRAVVDAADEPGSPLALHYQPQVGADGRITGVEALLRWADPELGPGAPADFIPLAEEPGLIVPLGAWVVRQACRQGRAWRDAGLGPLVLAVNVSPLQCAQPDFVERTLGTVAEAGFDPAWLELEITESCVMRDVADVAAKLRRLAAAGVRVAVDDFGTGHSSLAYLNELPVHRLKIDRAFVRRLDPATIADRARTVVVRAIASLGRSLHIGVVAEGVETVAQRDFLREIGCDDLQGYLFAPPVPAAALTGMLSTGSGARSAA